MPNIWNYMLEGVGKVGNRMEIYKYHRSDKEGLRASEMWHYSSHSESLDGLEQEPKALVSTDRTVAPSSFKLFENIP